MAYRAAVDDMLFTLRHAAGFAQGQADGLYDLGDDLVGTIIGKPAGLRPTCWRRSTARKPPWHPFRNGEVTTAPAKKAYRDWAGRMERLPPCRVGRPGPAAGASRLHGNVNSASMAFGVSPMLTMAALDCFRYTWVGGTQDHLPAQLISGEWMGTMQLTEPHAGSDVERCAPCQRAADGSYRPPAPRYSSPWRARPHRQHHSFRARASPAPRKAPEACRCSWCRNSWWKRTAPSVPATTCAAIRSSTSWGSTARRPASWSMATAAAPSAISSARKTAAWPACSP